MQTRANSTKNTLFCLIVGLIAIMTACEDNPNLDYSPQFIAPLAKGEIGVQDQADLENVPFNLINSIGLNSPTPVAVPPYSNLTTGTTSFSFSQPPFVLISVDTLVFEGSFSNNTGVTLSAGAELVIRNVGETNPLFIYTLPQNIATKTSFNFSVKLANLLVKPNLELFVRKLGSPGSTTPVVMSNNSIRLVFNLKFSKINYIDFPPNIASTFSTIVDFDLGLGEADDISGNLVLNLANQAPLNFAIVVELLAEDKATRLALLSNMPISMNAGSPTLPTEKQITINASEVLNSLKNTKYLRVSAAFNTNGATGNVRVDRATVLAYQLIGDFKITGNSR